MRIYKIKSILRNIKNMYLIYHYGKHLQKRIEKNNFGRRPEY